MLYEKTYTYETGLSNHHKLVGTVRRSTFAKGKSDKIFYSCYKNFNHENFKEELKKQLRKCHIFNEFSLHLHT